MLNWNNECGVKLCEIYDEGCSSLSFDYTCKIRDGTELEMETQSDTRHNLKTNRLFALREAAASLSFIYNKKKKKKCLKADMWQCV